MRRTEFSTLKALILDMDGVLWRGEQPIGDLLAVFSRIASLDLLAALATNNATLSARQYLQKLANFGVHLQPEQIVNSSQAAAHYLARRFPHGGAVYVVGEAGLVDTLAEQGFISQDSDGKPKPAGERQILAVVVGLDRSLDYHKLTAAARLVRAGAMFIGTNPDRTYPAPDGLVPGAGAILAAIEAATDVPPVIVGKPSPEMYTVALQRMGVKPGDALVVGDRLETDIVGGQQLGCRTALVLSGVTPVEAAGRWQPAPDWIAPDLTTLLSWFADR
jgi:4-nitrophenyl phosphatase